MPSASDMNHSFPSRPARERAGKTTSQSIGTDWSAQIIEDASALSKIGVSERF